MQEVTGDLWELAKGQIVVITTNGFVKKNGECVMGRGVALDAKSKWPTLPYLLGQDILRWGNVVLMYEVSDYAKLIALPVKHNWWEKADIELIAKSIQQLAKDTEQLDFKVYIPRPGCGNGGLKWEDVKPILEKYLDDKFIVCNKE